MHRLSEAPLAQLLAWCRVAHMTPSGYCDALRASALLMHERCAKQNCSAGHQHGMHTPSDEFPAFGRHSQATHCRPPSNAFPAFAFSRPSPSNASQAYGLHTPSDAFPAFGRHSPSNASQAYCLQTPSDSVLPFGRHFTKQRIAR